MALAQGVHILAHRQKSEARRIAVDIQQHQRLLVGTNTMYGEGYMHGISIPFHRIFVHMVSSAF